MRLNCPFRETCFIGFNAMERVIIIGAGVAGLTAACETAQQGVSCVLVSLQHSERTQSVLAEGGISAAVDAENTIEKGAFLADPKAVQGMADAAPEVVDWLQGLGVPFASDGSDLLLRRMGGHCKPTPHMYRTAPGKQS